jgi:hypothetical protein
MTLILVAVVLVVIYLPRSKHTARSRVIGGDRPWRRLGAVICLLLAVMFAAGVRWLNPAAGPYGYLAYWTVMLGLVVWLCALAIKDAMYTRALIAGRRGGTAGVNPAPRGDEPSGDSPQP